MNATVLEIAAGASSVLGLIGILSYFVLVSRLTALERTSESSIRATVEGQGIFRADPVIKILKQFRTDEARLAALKALAASQKRSQDSAVHVYEAIRNDARLIDSHHQQLREYRRISGGTSVALLLLGALGTTYGLISVPEFRKDILAIADRFLPGPTYPDICEITSNNQATIVTMGHSFSWFCPEPLKAGVYQFSLDAAPSAEEATRSDWSLKLIVRSKQETIEIPAGSGQIDMEVPNTTLPTRWSANSAVEIPYDGSSIEVQLTVVNTYSHADFSHPSNAGVSIPRPANIQLRKIRDLG